jgi:DNA-binding transcriptional ArsR family regulator
MSTSTRRSTFRRLRDQADVFAALGDDTRLRILSELSDGDRRSITRLAEGSPLTRQAVTKHLRVLERAGLVRGERRGRENLFRVEAGTLRDARDALDRVSRHWDRALARLKAHVED